MKFSELDKKMRVYETVSDLSVLPSVYMVARVDGRSFTRLTKEVHKFESPYDSKFRDMMIATVEHLMKCGFNVKYGYTQSDEISLLFSRGDNAFDRKLRKLNSVLAGEASAKFSLLLGNLGVFDCRISQLPTTKLVCDYFRWRNEDANRNALNAHCYWSLRKQGKTPKQADSLLSGLSVADKNEILFKQGINYNDIPNWQKRGVGLYWQSYSKLAINQKTGEETTANKNKIKIDYDLPIKDGYNQFIANFFQ